MAKYKIIQPYPIGAGSVLDRTNTPIPIAQLAPQVGDTVEGELTTRIINGQPFIALDYPVSVVKQGATPAQKAVITIPFDSLDVSLKALKNDTGDTDSEKSPLPFLIGCPIIFTGIAYSYYTYKHDAGSGSISALLSYCAVAAVFGIFAGVAINKLRTQ